MSVFGIFKPQGLRIHNAICFCVIIFIICNQFVWGQQKGFQVNPQAIDNMDGDSVFSPNGDGVQDKLLIVLTMDGTTGEYRIIIDVHSPGGVGQPDGKFEPDDDWMVMGDFGPGPPNSAEKRIIIHEWDGRNHHSNQDATLRQLQDGTYEIQIEIDFFRNDEFNPSTPEHTVKLTSVIDTKSPQTSANLSRAQFSPNGDGRQDINTLSYSIAEDLTTLELEFANLTNRPPISLTDLTSGNHTFLWNGKDGLNQTITDGNHTLQLKATDQGGNTLTSPVSQIQIDTEPPIIAQISPANSSYQKTAVSQIVVSFESDSSSSINFDETLLTLKNSNDTNIAGSLESSGNQLRFSLANQMDTVDENDVYTATITGVDLAGNKMQTSSTFTFDTVVPAITEIKVNDSPATSGVKAQVNYVEAILNDSVGLNLLDTTIRLIRNGGEIAGQQTAINETTIRWVLTTPLATDGSTDGAYEILVSAADLASNTSQRQINFIYDTQKPKLASISPTDYTNLPVKTIAANFSDPNGSGIDFNTTRLILRKDDVLVNGTIVTNGDTLEFQLDEPLEMLDGTQDGKYTVDLKYVDIAGNSQNDIIDLIYDTRLPVLQSTTPAVNTTVSSLTQVMVVLNDQLSGIDLSSTQTRLFHNGTQIGATVRYIGKTTVGLIIAEPISQAGEYVIEVTPVDFAGNVGANTKIPFFFTEATPAIGLVPDVTDPVSDLTNLTAQILNYVGPKIDFSKSTITLKTADGEIVSANPIENDGLEQLQWKIQNQLPADGSADGSYVLNVSYVDVAGRNFSEDFPVIFDTQAPKITDESRPEDRNVLVTNQVSVEFEVTDVSSEMDFSSSTVQLLNQGGTPIQGETENNGKNKISFSSALLTSAGTYVLNITLADIAGNVGVTQQFNYQLEIASPSVASITPANRSKVQELKQITVELVDGNGAGLDFSSDATSAELRNSSGQLVDSKTTNNGIDKITIKIVPELLEDGSDDGEYTVSIQPIDKRGMVGDARQFSINYDSQNPVITSITSIDTTKNISYFNQPVNRFETVVTDLGSGIDFSQSSVQILDVNSKVVVGTQGHDKNNNFWLQLDQPFTQVGNQDGQYVIHVKATDNAGNNVTETFKLHYDTQPPSTDLNAYPKQVSSPVDKISLNFTDPSGVDFSQTSIVLFGPNGSSVTANQTTDGEKAVSIQFDMLETDGSDDGTYQIQVNAVDVAGNASSFVQQFLYSTQKPEIASTTPEDFGVVNELGTVSVNLIDRSGKGIDFGQSKVNLLDSNGKLVVGRQEVDESQSIIHWVLKQKLPRDGSADGEYTIQISAVDLAKNSVDSKMTFTVDTIVPSIKQVQLDTKKPTELKDQLVVVEETFSSITVVLSDGGIGADLNGTTVQLVDPQGEVIGVNLISNKSDSITASFSTLHEVGTYKVGISPKDNAENVGHMVEYQFHLDLQLPTVSKIEVGEFFNKVTATLSGSNLNTSNGSSIVVMGSQGAVDGQITRSSTQVVWSPLHLETDGSDDDIYTITVTPIDVFGRSGTPRIQKYIFDTQEPEIISITVVDLNQPVSYLSTSISQIAMQVQDLGPAELEIGNQKIKLQNESGKQISATSTNDGNEWVFLTLNQPLVTDGSDDGGYAVTIDLIDKASNKKQVLHQITYDTLAPTLISTIPANNSEIRETITSIVANVEDAGDSKIDFAQTTLTLLNQNGNSVNGEFSHDGQSKLTLEIDGLKESGTYTVRVELIDRAGNTMTSENYFLYLMHLPSVSSTIPKTSPAEEAFTNESFGQVELKLDSGKSNLSTISLVGPSGKIMPGQQSRSGDRLVYELFQKPTEDGTNDGQYTIVFTPVNSNGGQGEPQNFTFTYDTIIPEIMENSISMTVVEPGVNNSLLELQVEMFDDEPSSSLDWEDDKVAYIQLFQIAADGSKSEISGVESIDEDANTVSLILTKPLASDGGQDGNYLVQFTAKDQAGNLSKVFEYDFIYDTRPPVIDVAALTLNEQPLILNANDPDYPSVAGRGASVSIITKMSDAGQGVDLARSSILVRSPNGAEVAGDVVHNGVDQVTFKSAGLLTNEGMYKINITSAGLDPEKLGFQPTTTLATEFLYEITPPVIQLTDRGDTEVKDDPLRLRGTSVDSPQNSIPASGVVSVEIIGKNPEGLDIDPVLADDVSQGSQEPWSLWEIDYLPPTSGEYVLSIRVTDRAGNAEVYEELTVDFTVSLGFKDETYCWPNPLRKSQGDIAHISFDPNVSNNETVDITLSIYDFAGYLVYKKDYPRMQAGRTDQIVTWNLNNDSNRSVARGIYIFRLEANREDENANVIGKILVVE